MNYDRIYKYRFKGINQEKKILTWKIIADFLYKELGKPKKILDPACGLCEFINAVPSEEKWAIDLNDEFVSQYISKDVKKIIGNSLEVELPENYFDAVFISNFLEHLHSQEEVADFLQKMYKAIKPGGRIAVMGPNYKYMTKYYFDFADHTVVLSETGVAEHLYGAGFDDLKIVPKFLPMSFRSRFPVSKFLVNLYLRMPFAWKIVGKQFLLVGIKSQS
ncbi:MAG: methyltransferase domain-containing protein [Chitinophagaceae bacterium]